MADTPAQAALRAAFNSKLSLSATLDDLPESFLDEFFPAGEFVICAGTTLPPRTLLCNGAAVSRTTYSRLFAAIGTKYGSGDGSTTFNLPNLDGRVLQGTSDTSSVGQYLEASLPNITGFFSMSTSGQYFFHTEKTAGAFSSFSTQTNVLSSVSGSSETSEYGVAIDASRVSSAYGGKTIQPLAVTVLTCIRY